MIVTFHRGYKITAKQYLNAGWYFDVLNLGSSLLNDDKMWNEYTVIEAANKCIDQFIDVYITGQCHPYFGIKN